MRLIKVLGHGSPKCRAPDGEGRRAVAELAVEAKIEGWPEEDIAFLGGLQGASLVLFNLF